MSEMAAKAKTTDTTPASVTKNCAAVLAAAEFAVGSAGLRAEAQRDERIRKADAVLAAAKVEWETAKYEADREARGLVESAQRAAAAARETALASFDEAQRELWSAPDATMTAVATGGYQLVVGRRVVGTYVETTAGHFRYDDAAGRHFSGSELDARRATWALLGEG